MRNPAVRYWWLATVLLLGACSGLTTREQDTADPQAYLERAGRLAAIEHWGLVGRLSLDDGEQGGSGTLRWNVDPAGSDLDFRGTMGRGAWQLELRPGSATLKLANGEIQTAPDIDSLVMDRVGWPVPVEALAWWVRGLRAPGAVDSEEVDANGLLLSLTQSGWSVDFKRYRVVEGVPLPVSLEAQRNSYRVKLAAGRWRLGSEGSK